MLIKQVRETYEAQPVRVKLKKDRPGVLDYSLCFTPFLIPDDNKPRKNFVDFLYLRNARVTMDGGGDLRLGDVREEFDERDELVLHGDLTVRWAPDGDFEITGLVESLLLNDNELVQTRWAQIPDEVKGAIVGSFLGYLAGALVGRRKSEVST